MRVTPLNEAWHLMKQRHRYAVWSKPDSFTQWSESELTGKHQGGTDSTVRPPKVKHRIKGVWKATPYTRTAINQQAPDGVGWYVHGSAADRTNIHQYIGRYQTKSSSWWDSNLLHTASADAGIFANLRNRAEVQAMLAISTGEVEVGVALAESQRTLQMISEAFAELSGGIADASRGNWAAVRRRFGSPRGPKGRSISSKWLAYQYGWLPLMMDIYGLHEELKKGLLQKGQVLTGRSAVSESIERSETTTQFTSSTTLNISKECGVSCSLTAIVDEPTLARLNQLGLINPLSIAWELVPWSFVLDWGIPIGNVLRAFSAPVGLQFFTGSVTYRTYISLSGNWPTPMTYRPREFTPVKVGTAHGLRMQRVVLGSFPVPKVYTRPIFSTKRMLNALALADQNMGRIRR